MAADADRLLALRAPLIRRMVAAGHKVLCVTAVARDASRSAMDAIGVQHADFMLPPGPLKLLSDRAATRALSATLRGWQASVVIGMGGKAMQMAGLAARGLPGVRILLIASSPDVLTTEMVRAPLGRRWIAGRAFAAADAIVAHNDEDAAALRALDVMRPGCSLHVLPGAGVDTAFFEPLPLPPTAHGLVFGMIAQPHARKGMADFLAAARLVRRSAPATRFVLARLPLAGPAVATAGFDDAVEVVDAPTDIRPLLARCHVFVLPSQRECFAHEVAEALACGRPSITTNVAGCRETVDERVSGVLVPPGDVDALAAAMASFVRRPEQLGWMSRAARLKAERRFDANAVNGKLMGILDHLQRG